MLRPHTLLPTPQRVSLLISHGLIYMNYSNRFVRLPAYYRDLKKYHMEHHFKDFENGFGVSNRFWDRVFGTELHPGKVSTKRKAA